MTRIAILAAALIAAAPALAQTMPAMKPAAPTAAPAHPAAMTPETARLDVNAATVDQLAGVKGLNKTYAEAIVKARPFKTLDELTTNKILPADVFAQVKDLLTVRQK